MGIKVYPKVNELDWQSLRNSEELERWLKVKGIFEEYGS